MRVHVALSLAGSMVVLGVAGTVVAQHWEARTPVLSGATQQELDAGTLPRVSRPRPAATGTGPGQVPLVDATWVARAADATGIPRPAVTAYARATLATPRGCDLGWTTLAGIGWVESQHGTIGGRALGVDGRSSSVILGPALDGGEGVAAIRATAESARLHGNAAWDHAMGPMQFIPSTWERWGRDGDGDGVVDPHDLDDAAASAAAYLCHDGHDLTSSGGWNAAVFSYNHDNSYVGSVHAAANRYGLAMSGR